MAKYYFTYGSDQRFPFQNGYTLIEAESYSEAARAFQKFHPSRVPGSEVLNCAMSGPEDWFIKTGMYSAPELFRLKERIDIELVDCDFDEDGFMYEETIRYRRTVLDE